MNGRIKQRMLVLAAISALVSTGPGVWANAQGDDALQLAPVIVTARGRETPLSLTPGGVGVVDAERIFQTQPLSLSNAVRRVPGVEKSSDSAWGSAINIRGLSRNRVVFLVDGARVNTATDINARFGMLHPRDVERIEILKGPVSALYGSGSVGGVVNVISRKADFAEERTVSGGVSAEYSSVSDGWGMFGNVELRAPKYWVYASGGGRTHDDYEAGNGKTVPNSRFEDAYGRLHLGYKWDEANVSEIQVQHSDANEVGIPGKGLALPDPPRVTYPDSSRTLVQFTHTLSPQADFWEKSRLMLYWQRVERRVRIDEFPPAAPMREIRPEADHNTLGAKWSNTLRFEPHTIVAGLDVWHWAYEGERSKELASGATGVDNPLADSGQLSMGVFAEDDWTLAPAWTLNLGARADYLRAETDDLYDWVTPPGPFSPTLKQPEETHYDTSWSGHAGLTWQATPTWAFSGLVASSYRAPDLMDRYKYINLGGGVELYGNPELDPERSLFTELTAHWTGDDRRLSLSLFHNRVEDLIVEETVTPTRHEMANVETARLIGAEADAEWRPNDRVTLYGTLSYVRGRDTSEDEDLPFIPPLGGLLGARIEDEKGFWGGVEIDWATDQNRTAPNEEKTAGWAAVHLRAGREFVWNELRHEVVLSLENALDADYRNHLSTSRGIELREPGRSLEATWSVAF